MRSPVTLGDADVEDRPGDHWQTVWPRPDLPWQWENAVLTVCSFLPAGLHAATTAALHAAIVKGTAGAFAQERLVAGGVVPATDASPAAFAQRVQDDFVRWGRVVKDAGIRLE